MNLNLVDSPTVLLLEACSHERVSTKIWLEENGYNVLEVESVFAALETMSDFTLDSRPTCVLLSADFSTPDCIEAKQMLREFDEFKGVPIYDDRQCLLPSTNVLTALQAA
jgi:DNA-binding response OmpR family regulator